MSVICLFIQFSDLGVGHDRSQMKGFEMCGRGRIFSSFVLLSGLHEISAQSHHWSLINTRLSHIPLLSGPWPCFVSLHATDHCLPLWNVFLSKFSCPHKTPKFPELRESALFPIPATSVLDPGHGLTLQRPCYMPLKHCPWIWHVSFFWSFVNEKTAAQKGGIANPKVSQLQATEQDLKWSLNPCALIVYPKHFHGDDIAPRGAKIGS